MEDGEIKYIRFDNEKTVNIKVTHYETKHCGGDSGIVEEFIRRINENDVKFDKYMIESHLMAFAAEKSRNSNQMITL